MNIQLLTFISVGFIFFAACSSSKSSSTSADCSISEYAVYYYNNSQNAHCGEEYNDSSKLYGFGDSRGREGQDEMMKRIAGTIARSELGQKAAGYQNKIKGSIERVISQNEDGESSSSTMLSMHFEMELKNVETIGETCENSPSGYKCYVLVEMPKSQLLESAEASLKRENMGLYQAWTSSNEYESLLAEMN